MAENLLSPSGHCFRKLYCRRRILYVYLSGFPSMHTHLPQSKGSQAQTYLEEAKRAHQDGLNTTEEFEGILLVDGGKMNVSEPKGCAG